MNSFGTLSRLIGRRSAVLLQPTSPCITFPSTGRARLSSLLSDWPFEQHSSQHTSASKSYITKASPRRSSENRFKHSSNFPRSCGLLHSPRWIGSNDFVGSRSYYTYSHEPFHPLKRQPKWLSPDEAVKVIKSGGWNTSFFIWTSNLNKFCIQNFKLKTMLLKFTSLLLLSLNLVKLMIKNVAWKLY